MTNNAWRNVVKQLFLVKNSSYSCLFPFFREINDGGRRCIVKWCSWQKYTCAILWEGKTWSPTITGQWPTVLKEYVSFRTYLLCSADFTYARQHDTFWERFLNLLRKKSSIITTHITYCLLKTLKRSFWWKACIYKGKQLYLFWFLLLHWKFYHPNSYSYNKQWKRRHKHSPETISFSEFNALCRCV